MRGLSSTCAREVPRVEYEKLSEARLGEPCAAVQARVEAARSIMITLRPITINLLSARACHRILMLARTIAGLAGSESIQPSHLAEALQSRPRVMDAA